MRVLFKSTLIVLAAVLSACTTAQPVVPKAPVLISISPEQMVAVIRAAAGLTGEGELAVQPLRDPAVEDLRQAATQAESLHRYEEAAASLDAALKILPNDPGLLQERAEIALLTSDIDAAEHYALRAYELGPQVGPFCRRHWKTVEQARLVAGDAPGAASATKQVKGCTVPAPNRF